jgi:DNA primase
MSAQHSVAVPHARIDTDRLRLNHPIADLITRYGIELRRSGSTLVGRCPFHQDGGRPNLTVFLRSGRFVCFRCQARGDAISFVQQLEHVTFREAAERLGADPNPSSIGDLGRHPRQRRARARTAVEHDPTRTAVLSAAAELYRNRLLVDPGPLTYLAERGFGKEVVEQAQLGYAAGGELVPYLAWRRLPAHAARRAGLLDSDGRERLAGRIVFPEVRDGEPIWLIGRLLDADSQDPRYLGLPGVKPLLGWEDADRDHRGTCLVEGPLDLLALRQWGVPGLALCGTGPSPDTVAQLARWDRLYAVLDADAAGQEATARLVDLLGARVIPVALPPGIKDPADLAQRPDGSELFRGAIRSAVAGRAKQGLAHSPGGLRAKSSANG